MRTVFKKIGLPSLWVFTLLVAFSYAENSASAQTAVPAPVTPPAAGSSDTISNLSNSAMGVAPTTAPAPQAAIAPIAAPTPPAVDTAADSDKGDKGTTLEAEESNVPKSVNAVMRHLSKESENITLNDLNSARQAIAKIETLIELEKKLGELEKVQKERQDKSVAANAVPASMLMPASIAPQTTDMPKFVPPPSMMMSDLDVDRIIGGAGEYKAVIKTLDGSTKTVAVGDTLPDGAIVSKISGSGMEVMHGDTKQTIRVKNVDMVFGVSP